MTTSVIDSPKAVELAKNLVDQISKAVADGDDAASAREVLSDLLRAQGGVTPPSNPHAAKKVEEKPAVDGLSLGEEKLARPNGEFYWTRKLGIHDDIAALRKAREEGINILCYGPPGTGKTALIEAAYADAESGARVYTVQGSGDTETADFIGGYVQLPDGMFQWVDGPLLRAMEEGAVCYIDEVALIDPKVLAVIYGVMDGRGEILVTANPERGVVTAKEGFYIVAACNPNAPGARMSEALTSRFTLQVLVTTDYKLVRQLGVPTKFVTAAQNLERKREKGEVGWSPQMRECLAFKKMAAVFGEDVALRNVISTAPEIDRPTVMDVLSRSFAKPLNELDLA